MARARARRRRPPAGFATFHFPVVPGIIAGSAAGISIMRARCRHMSCADQIADGRARHGDGIVSLSVEPGHASVARRLAPCADSSATTPRCRRRRCKRRCFYRPSAMLMVLMTCRRLFRLVSSIRAALRIGRCARSSRDLSGGQLAAQGKEISGLKTL